MEMTCTVKIYYRTVVSTGERVLCFTAFPSDMTPGAKDIALHPIRRDLWPTEEGKYIATFETTEEWTKNGYTHAEVLAPVEIHKKEWVSALEREIKR